MQFEIKNQVFGQGRPKICVPLVGDTQEQLVSEAQLAEKSSCEVVEWRVDLFEEVTNLEAVVTALREIRGNLPNKLLLVTFRTQAEGGQRDLSLHYYQELYEAVAATGQVELLDVELGVAEYLGRGFIQGLKKQGVGIILSYHNFQKTPADGELLLKVSVMKQFAADFGKLAVMPHELKDVLRFMNVSVQLAELTELPLVLISMGDLGKTTRVSGELIHSVMTFGSLTDSSAPGQIPVEELRQVLDVMHMEKSEWNGKEKNAENQCDSASRTKKDSL